MRPPTTITTCTERPFLERLSRAGPPAEDVQLLIHDHELLPCLNSAKPHSSAELDRRNDKIDHRSMRELRPALFIFLLPSATLSEGGGAVNRPVGLFCGDVERSHPGGSPH